MIKQSILIVSLVLLQAPWCLAVERFYPVFPVSDAIELDGRLTEKAWSGAPWSGELLPLRAEEPVQRSRFKALYNASHLYIGFEATEANMHAQQLKRSEGKRVWLDDSLELFLKPDGAAPYFRVGVNASGVRSDTRVEATAVRRAQGYTIEVAVPFSVLEREPKAGEILRGNVCRNSYTMATRPSTWSRLDRQFHEPHHFGALYLRPAAVSREQIGQIEAMINVVYSTAVAADAAEASREYGAWARRVRDAGMPNEKTQALLKDWETIAERASRYMRYIEYFTSLQADASFWERDHSRVTADGPCPMPATFIRTGPPTDAERNLRTHVLLMELFD